MFESLSIKVIELLRQYGFEEVTFEKLSISQQAEYMASAAVVIGPHGSGFTNIVFCSPKTKIIEIFSPEMVHFHYWTICNAIDLDYYYILGKGAEDPNYQQSWNAYADIEVDLDALKKVLHLANVNEEAV